jgi:hypothetical protein
MKRKHPMLGTKMRDTITGFEGVVVCYSQWLTGCNTFGLQAEVNKDGKVPETEWFDENRCEVIKAKPAVVDTANAGGPHPTPQQGQ